MRALRRVQVELPRHAITRCFAPRVFVVREHAISGEAERAAGDEGTEEEHQCVALGALHYRPWLVRKKRTAVASSSADPYCEANGSSDDRSASGAAESTTDSYEAMFLSAATICWLMSPAAANITPAAASPMRAHGTSSAHHPLSTAPSARTRDMMRRSSPAQYASALAASIGGRYAARTTTFSDSLSESLPVFDARSGNFSSSLIL